MGLYYFDAHKAMTKKHSTVLVNSVKENESMYTRQQLCKAALAKKSYSMVGRPGYASFMKMIQNNSIQNCLIDISDVKIAYKVYGPNVAALQGKTARRTPTHVSSTAIVPLPLDLINEHKDVTLCIDKLFIDCLTIFTTISRNPAFTTIEDIKNRKLETILPCITIVIDVYKHRGFKIVQIHSDCEFNSLCTPLLGLQIILNVTSANEHVPKVERNICLIKEHVCSKLASLPFETMPIIMKKELLKNQVQWINMVPHSNGINNNMSLHPIIHGTQTDYNVHCRIPFGSYCQINTEPDPSNTTTLRIIGAIAMNNQGNRQGGYNFMSLSSGK
jgi:hypothetical protein